jgi:monofunctional biosynthetic peptidoglycan transglycosylase
LSAAPDHPEDAPKRKRAPAKRKPKPKAEGAAATDTPKAPRKRAPRKPAAAKVAAPNPEGTPAKKAPARKRPAAKRKAAPKAVTPAAPVIHIAPAPKPAPAPQAPPRPAPQAAKPQPAKPTPVPKPSPKPAPKPRAPREKPPLLERVQTWFRNAVTVLVVLASLCLMRVASIAYVDPGRTPLMYIRYWQGAGEGRIAQEWREAADISPHLLLAIVAAEDQRFFEHHGVDWDELRKALDTADDGGPRGASTLTQQTAKNVFLWPSRSYIRKGLELCFTAAIEVCWSKQRILEIYANVAEFGPGVYGAEAAAQAYFGKTAADLTAEEGALLAACLPNPLDRTPADPSDAVRRKQAWILEQMNNLGGTAWLPEFKPRDKGKDKS